MWLGEPLVVEVNDNTVTPLGLEFWDEVSDTPLDMTNYTLVARFAATDGGTQLFNKTLDVVNAAAGQFDLVVEGASFGTGKGERVFSGQIIASNNDEDVTAARLVVIVNEGID